MTVRDRIYINNIFPYKKGHKANYVIMKVSRYVDGSPVSGQIHYDVYNMRYVEDEGSFFDECNLIEFASAANQASGGDINKFKPKKKKEVVNNG